MKSEERQVQNPANSVCQFCKSFSYTLSLIKRQHVLENMHGGRSQEGPHFSPQQMSCLFPLFYMQLFTILWGVSSINQELFIKYSSSSSSSSIFTSSSTYFILL